MQIRTSLKSGGTYYTVQYGDNLSYIANRFYGDESYNSVLKLYNANVKTIGPNPNLIQPGMVLWVP